MTKDNGGPAFPAPEASVARFGAGNEDAFMGLTVRDYFAARADIAVYTPVDSLYRKLGRNPTADEMATWIAEVRFIEADAMIAARSQL
jgi:hypothetical protein